MIKLSKVPVKMLRIHGTRAKIFLVCCLVFIAGTGVASFLSEKFLINEFYWFLGAVICLVFLILFWFNFKIRLAFLVGFLLCLAFWRYGLAIPESGPDKVWFYNGEKGVFAGMVSAEPDIRERGVKYTIAVEEFQNKEASGKVLVNAKLYPRLDYGDYVQVECKLERPEKIEDFAYDRYLARYGIYSLCYYPKIEVLANDKGNRLYALIFQLKKKIRAQLGAGLTEPEAGLAIGFILGDKRSIDNELNDKFAQVGISHIVAISGANISILINIIMALILGIGLDRRQSFYISSFILILYIILVGLPASAMRAGLMGFLVLWAIYLGRLNKITNALVLAAAVMIFINPKILRDDVGFQLSFLAMLSIVYLYPVLNSRLEKIKIPNKFALREVIAITLATQILTLPIMISDFQQISLIVLLSNFLVIWSLSFLMVALPLAVIFHSIFSSQFIFFIPQIVLSFVVSVAEKLSVIPYSYVKINMDWWWIWVIYYFIICFLILKYKKRRPLC